LEGRDTESAVRNTPTTEPEAQPQEVLP